MVPSFFPYRHNVSLLYPRKTNEATQETCFYRCVEPQCQAWCRTPLNRYVHVLFVHINNPSYKLFTIFREFKEITLNKEGQEQSSNQQGGLEFHRLVFPYTAAAGLNT